MTGYQSAPTIGNAVSDYSSIGGLLYSFLGPTLESIAKQHLGIKPHVNLFDPRSSGHARTQDMFNQSDLGAARESFVSYDKLYGAKQGNTIFGTLWNMATNKLSGQDNIAPNLYSTLINSGVRGSWANPNKTILESYNAGLKGPKVAERDIYDFFTDALITRSAQGISKAERSELASNYIRSNFGTLAEYSTKRNTEWLGQQEDLLKKVLKVDNGVIANSEANGYTLSKKAYDAIHDKVTELNKQLGKEKLSEGLNYSGDNSNVKSILKDLQKLDKEAGELVSFELDSDGKVKILREVKTSLNKFDKEIGNYFNAVKQWSELLGTSVEGASANLNSLIGMDYAATFNNNHQFSNRVATDATHINALSGKGNAFTQTAIHAAASVLKQMGGDTAASLITGRRAALYSNPFGTRYRLNNEALDTFNVTMSAGYQEAETNQLFSAMFAAGGYETSEEGRRKFWEDVNKKGITASNITFDSALNFANASRGKDNKLTSAAFWQMRNVGSALDFRATDNTVQRMNERAMLDSAGSAVLDHIGRDSKAGQQLEKVFESDAQTAEFWNAMGMQNGAERTKILQSLGITDISANDLEASIYSAFDNDTGAVGQALRAAGGDKRILMANLSGTASSGQREAEVKARTEASMLLKDMEGDTLMDKVVSLSKKNDVSIDNVKKIAEKAFAGSPYSPEMLKTAFATKDSSGKDVSANTLRQRVRTMANNLSAADSALADEKYQIEGEDARKKILKAVKEKRITEDRASRLLTAAGIHGAKFDDKGNLTSANYDADHASLMKDPKKRGALDSATDELASFMAKESETGLRKTQLDKILIQNNQDVRTMGTNQEKDLAAARIFATKQWVEAGENFSKAKADVKDLEDKFGEDALLNGRIKDGTITTYNGINKVSEEEIKKIEAFRNAAKKQQESIELTQKLGVKGGSNKGTELVWEDQESFLKKEGKVSALNNVLDRHNKDIQSAAQKAGIEHKTGADALLDQIRRLLEKLVSKFGA